MAIDSKKSFLSQLEKCMDAFVPADIVRKITATAADLLCKFDMSELQTYSVDSDDFLAEYIAAMKVQGRSAKTIKRYKYVIERFMKTVGVPCREITVHHLRNYFTMERREQQFY